MKTFQDLMRECPNKTTDSYIPSTPDMDPVVVSYNNLWGALSDTHMSSFNGQYLITGGRVNTYDWFRDFISADSYQGNQFPEGSFTYYMMRHNLCGGRVLVNGQYAFLVKTWIAPEDQPTKPNPVFLDGFEVGPNRQPMDSVVGLTMVPAVDNI